MYQQIQPGYPVFARPVDPVNDSRPGPFVGVVDDLLDSRGVPYLHLRGSLEQARELFLPIGTVRTVVDHQVRLDLTRADIVDQAWQEPPSTLLHAM
jgi:hypothetical protein